MQLQRTFTIPKIVVKLAVLSLLVLGLVLAFNYSVTALVNWHDREFVQPFLSQVQ